MDIWVEDVSGESLKIRERPQVKIGHIAVGISEQVRFLCEVIPLQVVLCNIYHVIISNLILSLLIDKIVSQISLRTFSLATLDGRLVSPDTEVCESGMWLQCVPAPDGNPSWDWRVRDGKLELQEYDGHSDSCSTLAL